MGLHRRVDVQDILEWALAWIYGTNSSTYTPYERKRKQSISEIVLVTALVFRVE